LYLGAASNTPSEGSPLELTLADQHRTETLRDNDYFL
jgi:hypothetical protein